MVYGFGPFTLEKEQLLLCLGDRPLALGPKVVETLLALIERPGQVVTKNELLDRVWPEGFVEEANLAQNIYVIRKTLRAYWPQDVIETLPRRGYRFVAHAVVHAAPVPPVPVSAPQTAALSAMTGRPRRRFWAPAAIACAFVMAIAGATFDVANSHPKSAVRPLSEKGARLYAMGKYYWNQRTSDGMAKSERYFAQVTVTDPRDPRGYAALASAYAIDADYGYGTLTRKAALAHAASFASKAIALDARSAEAYAVLGLVAVDRHDMTGAFAAYRRALALDPSSAPAHQWYGAALLRSGKAVAGYQELQKAANLDPSSVATTDWLAQAAYISRRYQDAVAYGRQTLDLSPERTGVYQTIGMAYEALGNERAAISAYKMYARSCAQCRYDAAALLAHAYALSHDARAAGEQLEIARAGFAVQAVAADNLLLAYVASGHRDEALKLLRSGKLDEPAALLAIDPRMDALRGDSAFRRYMRTAG